MDWLEVVPDLDSPDSGWKLVRSDLYFLIDPQGNEEHYRANISNFEHIQSGDIIGNVSYYVNDSNKNIKTYSIYLFGESESHFRIWYSRLRQKEEFGFALKINGIWVPKKSDEIMVFNYEKLPEEDCRLTIKFVSRNDRKDMSSVLIRTGKLL